MAYLDLSEAGSMPAPQFSGMHRTDLQKISTVVQPRLHAFTTRERTVIDLARDDRLSSLREESEFVEFLRLIFGMKRQTPLANPKLEALRRLAVLSWHNGYNVSTRDLTDFLNAGYSLDQYEAMLAHIGSERAASAHINRFGGNRR